MKQAQATGGHDHAVPVQNTHQIFLQNHSASVIGGSNASAAEVTAASPMEPPGCTRYFTPNLNSHHKDIDKSGENLPAY
jgi:hypothetical protein